MPHHMHLLESCEEESLADIVQIEKPLNVVFGELLQMDLIFRDDYPYLVVRKASERDLEVVNCVDMLSHWFFVQWGLCKPIDSSLVFFHFEDIEGESHVEEGLRRILQNHECASFCLEEIRAVEIVEVLSLDFVCFLSGRRS